VYSAEIQKINNYLKTQGWMDFEVCQIGIGEIRLHGFIDGFTDDKIVIRFKQCNMISCRLWFNYDPGEGDFLSIAQGEEAYQINGKYDILQGNTVFKISNVGMGFIGTPMYIAAERLEVEIKG